MPAPDISRFNDLGTDEQTLPSTNEENIDWWDTLSNEEKLEFRKARRESWRQSLLAVGKDPDARREGFLEGASCCY
ncbi:MAG: hypothetical protein WBK77_03135 [Alphaproteobacteria bacterium]